MAFLPSKVHSVVCAGVARLFKALRMKKSFPALAVGVFLALVCGSAVFGLEFPGSSPGEALTRVEKARGLFVDKTSYTLENNVIGVSWVVKNRKLQLTGIQNKMAGTTYEHKSGEAFTIELSGGRKIKTSDLELMGKPVVEKIAADPFAARLVDRYGGKQLVLNFRTKDKKFQITWRAILRDGSNYVRQIVAVTTKGGDDSVEGLTLVDLGLPNGQVAGEVDGSPAVADSIFVAYEHPMAKCETNDGRVRCFSKTKPRLNQAGVFEQSSVIGVVPEGQLRRAFLYYLERERAHPYRPFLHYNSWYHLGWGGANGPGEAYRPMNSKDAFLAIENMGRELVEKRNVKMDGFVFDDGWDNPATLWGFHDGFPDGFAQEQTVAQSYGSTLGAWLSPWGGYDPGKTQRLEYGKKEGFETNENGFSLAGSKYYSRFLQTCGDMVKCYNLGYFKFDGVGAGNNSCGAGREYAADIMSLLNLIGDLRKAQPEVFVNTTVGTWPSPYWLWFSDSTWRSGDDMNFFGSGPLREQWITYRDMEAYRNIVRRGPLYPLNSLMFHGPLVVGKGKDQGIVSKLENDPGMVRNEIRSFFGTGCNVQELYITPEAMTPEMWDSLAETAKWSRENADVLVDSHWVGGDPGTGAVYGFASWSPRKGIVVLRNPDSKPSTIMLDLAKTFEIPKGAAAQAYLLQSPFEKEKGASEYRFEPGMRYQISLQPFEVLVYEAHPISSNASMAGTKEDAASENVTSITSAE